MIGIGIIIFVYSGSLFKVTSTRGPLSNLFTALKFNYSLFFLQGNDKRQLNLSLSKEILSQLKESNSSTSSLLYNSHETKRKYHSWNKALPWIKPHYAIKANPSDVILNDLIEEGSNFDCASKTEI